MSPGPGCPPGALISQSWSLSTSSLCDRDVCSTPRPAGCLAHVRLPSSLLEAPRLSASACRLAAPSAGRAGGSLAVSGGSWELGATFLPGCLGRGTVTALDTGATLELREATADRESGGTPPTESAQGAGPECARLLPRRLRSRAPAAENRPGRALPARSAQRASPAVASPAGAGSLHSPAEVSSSIQNVNDFAHRCLSRAD